MNKQFYVVMVVGMVIISGCGSGSQQKEIVAKVNNYEITKDRFEAEFKESIYGRNDTLESRKQFLSNLIDRKLILQEAQSKGLDKQQEFLRMIEKFWEQSLLKLALDKKTQEIADAAVKNTGTGGQLKKEKAGDEESQAIIEWITDLHKSAKVEVREELLKK